MDSPLLPQLNRHPDMSLLDDPSMLADLTMDSDGPGSPSHSHPFGLDRSQSQSQSQSQAENRGQGQDRSALSHASASARSQSQYSSQAGGPIGHNGRKIMFDETTAKGGDAGSERDRERERPRTGASKPRFSLFAAPKPLEPEQPELVHEGDAPAQGEDVSGHGRGGDEQDGQAGEDHGEPGQTSAERETKLRESLYGLRKMNEVFEGFLGALEGVRGHNQRLAERISQTSALLDEYTAIMGQAEHTQRLMLNPRWTGASDDAEALAAVEAARQQAEQEAAEASRRAIEAARFAEEDKERRAIERTRAESAGRGRGRGVPASTRGGVGRGLPRGGPGAGTTTGTARARGTGIPRPSMAPTRPSSNGNPNGNGTGRTVSGAGAGAGGRGGGLGGQYSHVKSSGYGPRA
ncbi:hypothetical protein IAU60_001379 [Kwoniella sp. DSM 27419]